MKPDEVANVQSEKDEENIYLTWSEPAGILDLMYVIEYSSQWNSSVAVGFHVFFSVRLE